MKSKLILLLLILHYSSGFGSGELVTYTYFTSATKADFRKVMKDHHVPKMFAKARYDVDVYDITYMTKWYDGTSIKASGLYFVPKNFKGAMPQVVYHHGTRIKPGRIQNLGGEEYMCMAMAVDGYIVLMPDYIGLGNGEKFHLYQLAESIGQAAVDMIIAVRELNKKLDILTNEQLFLTGYSEGGYATLATQKMIQEKYSDEIKVTASSAMSGAYDMAGAQSEVMFRPYSQPHYLPFLLKSYNEVYKVVGNDINVIYKHPYDTLIPKLFDGKHGIGDINRALPEVPKNMIRDTFINLFVNDPNFAFIKALKANNVYDWKPEKPVQLCYCKADEQVTYKNSLIAYRKMRENGSRHILLRNAGKKYDHYKCAIFSSLYTKMYFDSFRKGSKYGRKGPLGKRMAIDIAKLFIKK